MSILNLYPETVFFINQNYFPRYLPTLILSPDNIQRALEVYRLGVENLVGITTATRMYWGYRYKRLENFLRNTKLWEPYIGWLYRKIRIKVLIKAMTPAVRDQDYWAEITFIGGYPEHIIYQPFDMSMVLSWSDKIIEYVDYVTQSYWYGLTHKNIQVSISIFDLDPTASYQDRELKRVAQELGVREEPLKKIFGLDKAGWVHKPPTCIDPLAWEMIMHTKYRTYLYRGTAETIKYLPFCRSSYTEEEYTVCTSYYIPDRCIEDMERAPEPKLWLTSFEEIVPYINIGVFTARSGKYTENVKRFEEWVRSPYQAIRAIDITPELREKIERGIEFMHRERRERGKHL